MDFEEMFPDLPINAVARLTDLYRIVRMAQIRPCIRCAELTQFRSKHTNHHVCSLTCFKEDVTSMNSDRGTIWS